MKKTIIKNLGLLILLVFAVNAQAQKNTLGFNFNLAAPNGDYATNVDHPIGISFNYLVSISKIKGLQVGGEAGVSMYANDEYDYDFNNQTIRLDEEDCYLAYHAVVRYRLVEGKLITPYVEGRLGGTSYFSSLVSNDDDAGFDDQHEFHGTTFSYGAGGGLLVRLGEHISIDASATAAFGLDTNYRSIDKTSPVELKTDLNAGVKNSSTNFVNFKLGLLFDF